MFIPLDECTKFVVCETNILYSVILHQELKHMPQPQEISVGPIDFKRYCGYCDRTVPEYILLRSFMNVFSDIHSEERLVGLWTRKVL